MIFKQIIIYFYLFLRCIKDGMFFVFARIDDNDEYNLPSSATARKSTQAVFAVVVFLSKSAA